MALKPGYSDRDGFPTMGSRARYIITSDEPDKPLVLRDLGPWTDHLTVTNDAERIVRDLRQTGRLVPGRQLFYFDSEGELTEITLDAECRFTGFRYAGSLS